MTEEEKDRLRTRLNEYRQQGLSRQQIADALGKTIYEVKRLIKTLGVQGRVVVKAPRKAKKEREKPRYSPLDEGETVIEKARAVLGARMSEDHRGYMLDGRPCSSWAILKAAGVTPAPVRKQS